MTRTGPAIFAAIAALALAAPTWAGDVAAGEKAFAKCKSCHMIVGADGTEVVKGGKIGPNLFGVVGRVAGSVPDFKYSEGLAAAGAKGLVWDEAMIAEYLVDPSKWLAANSGIEGARSKMTFKLAKGGEDVAAYLASVAPTPASN